MSDDIILRLLRNHSIFMPIRAAIMSDDIILRLLRNHSIFMPIRAAIMSDDIIACPARYCKAVLLFLSGFWIIFVTAAHPL